MMNYENDIFILSSTIENDYYNIISILEDNGKRMAKWFGFLELPQELKIHIFIEELEILKEIKKRLSINIPSYSIAFTANANKIYVSNYECLNHSITKIDYNKLILHECIHIFQMYFSRILPSKYVWLYETIACLLSEQDNACMPESEVSWNMFTKDFYNIKGCYGLAYKYGVKIFQNYSYEEVLNLIRKPNQYIIECKSIYESIKISI